MKKIISVLISVAVICTLCFGLTVEAASASLSGPAKVAPGQKITFSLWVDDIGNYGAQGEIYYDSNLLELNSISTDLPGWLTDRNESIFIVYDNNRANPISEECVLIKFNFTVLPNANDGSSGKVEVKNVKMDVTKNIFSSKEYSFSISTQPQDPSSSQNPTSSTPSSSTPPSSQQTGAGVGSTESSKTTSSSKTAGTTSSQPSTSSEDTVTSEESTVSEDLESSSPQKETVSDDVDENTEKGDKEDTNQGGAKWLIIILCVAVLGGAIGVLVYSKNKKNGR